MTAVDPEGPSRLTELGYHQGLRRRLHVWHVVGLSLADVSPTMAVLFLTAGVFLIGGTFAVGANILLAVVVVLICLCLAELGSMYPIAGGMYSLVRNVLPAPIAWITMFNYLLQGIVIPASIAIGIAQFLNDLFGTSISEKPFALVHPHQGLADIIFHPRVLDGNGLTVVGFGVMLATIAPAFNVINGYDATLGFTEELIGGDNAIAQAGAAAPNPA